MTNEKDRILKFMYIACKEKPFLRYKIARIVVLSLNIKQILVLQFISLIGTFQFIACCTCDREIAIHGTCTFFGNHENVFVRKRIFP